jgi:Putative zinc-finger
MDHEAVVRDKMTERYLLNELDAQEREQFEEHFFGCVDCALDVRAGAEFVAQSKVVLAEMPEPVFVRSAPPSRSLRDWFRGFRPAFAVPVMAALLLVIGYQNLVTYPRLQSELHQPQVLPWTSVHLGTWGNGGPTITVAQGKSFLLFVPIIPPDNCCASYTAELYNHDQKLEWSLTIPASPQQDQWPIQIPSANRQSGTYTLAVHGVTASGDTKEVGKASFELQVQK